MLKGNTEQPEPFFVQHGLQIVGKREFAEAALDRDLPKAGNADENLILACGDSR